MRPATRVALAALAFFLLTSRGLTVGDAALHLDVADGLVARGSTALSFDVGDLGVATERTAGGLLHLDDQGRVRASLPPGMAWLGAPFVAVGALFAERPLAEAIEPLFAPNTGSFRAALRPINLDPRAVAFALIGPLSGAASVLFVWLTLGAFELSRRARVAAVVALALSPLGVYAGTCWTQSVTAACLAFAMWGLTRERPLWAGLAIAAATLVRPDHAPLALPFALALGARWRSQAELLVPVALAGLGLALFFPAVPGGGFSWATAPEGLSGLLFSPLSGLFVYAPLSLVALFGVARMGRLGWLMLVPALQLAIYAGWFDWSASVAYGPRFLVPSLPVLAVAFGLAFERRRAPAWVAIAIGALLAIPGMLLAHVRVPEITAWTHPTFVDAWAVLLEGDGVGRWVDATVSYVPAQAWLTLVVAVAGMALELRGRRPSLPSSGKS